MHLTAGLGFCYMPDITGQPPVMSMVKRQGKRMAFLNMNREGVGLTVIGVASMALVAALGAFIYSLSFVRTAARADGHVVQLQKDESDPTSFHTVFTFRDSRGTEHTVRSALASSPPEYKVGDSVVVLYDTNSPADAKIRNFFSLWGMTFITALLGLLGLPVGIIISKWPLIAARFKGKHQTPYAA